MKKSTIITIIFFALGIIVLAVGFILLTDNNISNSLFPTTTTTTTGGGKPDPELKPMDFFKTDISEYITLGQYEGLEIEVESIGIDDEYLASQIDRLLISSGKYTKLFEGTVTEGMVSEERLEESVDEYIVIDDGKLILDDAVREELLIDFPRKLLCSEDCEGLCPKCGKPKKEGDCGCVTKEIDPRLEVLKKLLDK